MFSSIRTFLGKNCKVIRILGISGQFGSVRILSSVTPNAGSSPFLPLALLAAQLERLVGTPVSQGSGRPVHTLRYQRAPRRRQLSPADQRLLPHAVDVLRPRQLLDSRYQLRSRPLPCHLISNTRPPSPPRASACAQRHDDKFYARALAK